ncbi:type II secretion system protein GspK [Xanthobacter agilis]|uniref:General secretion pathway protein K n=1 Tax=Xanthobacter agilis TaxID=47492 RepID=A0ABU0L850_XANAG|nr:type II secretion system protein GspK [Xanthobacter agilis]MDQ0503331.1 general secretion pathway protein K [Xanthobacter agilis]
MTPPRTRPSGDDGFILVAVLWILIALATFAAAYAVYVAATVRSAVALEEEVAARPLARAALELTAFRLLAQSRDERPTRGGFSFRMGSAQIRVGFVEDTARIDLNAAPHELIAGLFSALGATPDAADGFARHVVAWRSSDPEDAPPEEAALYRDAQLGYAPRGAPFVHADELWRVAGLPPDLVAAALPHVTVFSGQAQVHPANADPVVQAAAGTRRADPGDDGPAPLPGHTDAVRVTIGMDFDSGRHRTIEAVILLRESGDTPYRILAWSEEELAAPMAVPGPYAPSAPGGSENGR